MTPGVAPDWLEPSELRVGLGCMRLSTDEERDEARSLETIAAAVEAGVTVFDTARAYGHGETELGHNERLLARALRDSGAAGSARVVTKGGMTRPRGGWVPDGRAKAIRRDCEESLEALGGVPIDLYLIHAPDPRTPWPTSVRALARLVDEGMVKRVGLSNVNRGQIDEALDLAPIAAVQVALSVFDDRALRGGVVERCAERGIAVMAHSPLGGPRRAKTIRRRDALAAIASAHDTSPEEIALAWLLDASPAIVPIPGARRPETARSAAAAARIALDDADRSSLAAAFGAARGSPTARHAEGGEPDTSGRGRAARSTRGGEVVLVMGLPGAGKTFIAREYVERGYVRLNRDERGGSLRELADAVDEEAASGAERIVLDSTYLTRASRSYVLDAAGRQGLAARCVWVDTPLAQAQVNVVERLLDVAGSLPDPDELKALARRGEGILAPTSQMRAARELEPPSDDEGWTALERIAFARKPPDYARQPGVFVAAGALEQPGWRNALGGADGEAPHLVFDWRPAATADDVADISAGGAAEALAGALAALAAEVTGPVATGLCPHPAGPPTCWCRPPLPGLPLAFARAHGVDPSRSVLIGASPAHRTLATTLGARYVEA